MAQQDQELKQLALPVNDEIGMLNRALEFWDALPHPVQVYLVCVLTVMAMVKVARHGWLSSIEPGAHRKMMFWRTAFTIGVISGLSGWYFYGTLENWFWIITSVTSGVSAIAVHHIILNMIIPWLLSLSWISAISKKKEIKTTKLQVFEKANMVELPKEKPEDPTRLAGYSKE